jgi:phosphoribosyl-AMP cyclohydrolase
MIPRSQINRLAKTQAPNETRSSPNHPVNPKQQKRLTPNWLCLADRPFRSALNRAPALATLSFYVSHLRRPAPSSPSSGDQCAAGPGLDRFCKSNERTPAAVPAGFFIAPVRFLHQKTPGLRSKTATSMSLDYSKLDGLIPAVIQDAASQRVLMVGFMNAEAFRKTCDTGFVTFYSRSRNKLWMKGESSGHRLVVKEISTDCDDDTLLIKVESLGPGVCHNGYESCFYKKLDGANSGEDHWIESETRTYDPAAIYGSKS